MQLSTNRSIALVLLDFVLFGIAAFLMLQVMPKPLKPFDYLLLEGVATLISLLGLWFLIWRETPNRAGLLFEKRPKQ